jgi:hypothetical protein
MTCVVVLHGEHMGSGGYVVGSERRRKGVSKIGKVISHQSKVKFGFGSPSRKIYGWRAK